ncbi:MAG: dipeptide/oligopeptide/nickel ABC transporter permease/ATP-binding protein [Protaetiibacter sp.]
MTDLRLGSAPDDETIRRSGRASVMLRRFVRHRLGMAALVVMAILVLVALLVPLWWPYGYGEITPELSQPPSPQHPMGTDTLGRDILAQVLRGLQHSLLIAGMVTLIACAIGLVLGLVSGFLGRVVDAAVMRLVDLVLTVPTLAVAAFLGSVVAAGGVSWIGLALVLGAMMWPPIARLVRGVTLTLRKLAFVDAATVMGAGRLRIMFRHLAPNVADHVVVAGTLTFGSAILAESALSFLGFGVQPPDTSLGLLVSSGQSAVLTRPWLFYFPGALVLVLVLSINYIGEGLRDAVNPRASTLNPLRRGRARPRAGAPEPGVETSLLSVSGLTVRFGDTTVVDDVRFRIAPGEVLAIVGESGSGKTLSALAIVGLLPPTAEIEGEILFRGESLVGLSYAQWQTIRGSRIAVIPQDPFTTLNPVLPILAQFADARRIDGPLPATFRDDIVDLMRSLAIKDPQRLLDQYPHQLSGGMRQRVVIALAMLRDPELIIADEPTTALDVTVQAQVMATLQLARKRTGAGMLFITHDLALVAGLADHVVVMRQGRVQESADVFTIFENPASDYTRQLLALAPTIAADGDRRVSDER